MKYCNLLVAIVLLAPTVLLSQNAIYQVVTTRYDTISGVLIEQDKRLTLATHPNQYRVSFQPKEILEYAVLHSDRGKEHYQFITIPGTKTLKPMRRVVNGELKLYVDKVEYTSKVNKGLPKGPTLVPKVDVFYIAHYSEDAEEVTRFNWREVLPRRLAGCPDLAAKIGQKGFKFKHLESIIVVYNLCMERTMELGSQ